MKGLEEVKMPRGSVKGITCKPTSSSLFLNLAKRMSRELKRLLGENLTSVVLFGSVGRKEARKDSDIDVLIIAVDLPRSRLKRVEIFLEAEAKLEEEFDRLREQGMSPVFSPILKTEREASYHSPLYLDMVDDAVILYDKGKFFSNTISSIKRGMEELGSQRVYVGKKWYWDLKPDYRFGEEIEL
jgi:predicted nucleotidyltransferase